MGVIIPQDLLSKNDQTTVQNQDIKQTKVRQKVFTIKSHNNLLVSEGNSEELKREFDDNLSEVSSNFSQLNAIMKNNKTLALEKKLNSQFYTPIRDKEMSDYDVDELSAPRMNDLDEI